MKNRTTQAEWRGALSEGIAELKTLRAKHNAGPGIETSATRQLLESYVAGEPLPKFHSSRDWQALEDLAYSDIESLKAKEQKPAAAAPSAVKPPPLPASHSTATTKPAPAAPKPAATSPAKPAPAPAATAVWDLDARQAEANRLLALPRDAAEIAAINKEAETFTPAGAAQRQRLQDMMGALPSGQTMNFYARFRAGFDTARSVGPQKASELPPPAARADAMTAAQFLSLPPAAQAELADKAQRKESGREARVELKRAHAAASPVMRLALEGVFGKALDAHKGEAI